MRTVEVVVVEDTADSVSGSVKSGNRLAFGIDDLSFGIDLRTAESRCHAAGKHEAVEGCLFDGVRLFKRGRNSKFVGRTVMNGSVEFFDGLLKCFDRNAHLFCEIGNSIRLVDFSFRFLIALDSSCDDRFIDNAGIDNDESAVFFDQLRRILTDIDVGLTFVDIAFALRSDANAEVDHVRRVSACGRVDRAGMELIHVDVLREERLSQCVVFAGNDCRAS